MHGGKPMRSLILMAAAAIATAPAFADDWPDLSGTWTGTSRAVVIGGGDHYERVDGSEARFVSADLTIEWQRQDEGRYVGTISSGGHVEPKLAVVASDRRTLRLADANGTSVGTIIDENTLEMCYAQVNPSMASCVIFTRQR